MGTIGRYISVIASWMLTLTSFLEVLCKIVALPDPIAKTLFGIFLMVSLLLSVHFFVYLMKMDAPNVKIPNKVNDYLNCIEKVERRNKSLHVISEKFDVNLIKAGNDVANQVAVRQRIQWTIRLANVDVATVGAFYMPITLGAYTAWQEKTLDIEVVLKKGDNSRILKPTQECFPDEDAASASVNMRTLQIIFPKGMEMHQSEQVYLYVTELKHRAELQEWAAQIQECRSSGLSVSEWCRQQGVTTTLLASFSGIPLSFAEAQILPSKKTVKMLRSGLKK